MMDILKGEVTVDVSGEALLQQACQIGLAEACREALHVWVLTAMIRANGTGHRYMSENYWLLVVSIACSCLSSSHLYLCHET